MENLGLGTRDWDWGLGGLRTCLGWIISFILSIIIVGVFVYVGVDLSLWVRGEDWQGMDREIAGGVFCNPGEEKCNDNGGTCGTTTHERIHSIAMLTSTI